MSNIKDFIEDLMPIVLGFVLVLSFVFSFVFHLKIHCSDEHMAECHYCEPEIIPVFSFKSGSAVSGSSYGFGALGSFVILGSVSEKEYVKYIIQTEYGLQVQRIESDDADIYFLEAEDSEPYLEIISGLNMYDCFCLFCFIDFNDKFGKPKYIFHLPPDSIVYDYSLEFE